MITLAQLTRGEIESRALGFGERLGLYATVLRVRERMFRLGPCTLCGAPVAPCSAEFYNPGLHDFFAGDLFAWLCWPCVKRDARETAANLRRMVVIPWGTR